LLACEKKNPVVRIWSLHPKYLDAKGLVALWRETLLAKLVLDGKTKGYRHHPQLERFRKLKRPTDGVHQYLAVIFDESVRRGYQFDSTKFRKPDAAQKIPVHRGQLEYEFRHLLEKLRVRDPTLHKKYKNTTKIDPHPMLRIVRGDIEPWEKTVKTGNG
jgi:hypothetical protein